MMYRGSRMFGGIGIIWILIIVIAIYFIIKYLNKNNNGLKSFKKENNAIETLNERYAKGEIDEEEYKKKKSMLEE